MSDCTIVERMPEAEYHARPEWSQSQFKLLPNEPELFYGRHVAKYPGWQLKPTPDMELGTALHAVILDGKPLVEIPGDVLTSNGQRRGKPWEQYQAEHADDLIMLPKEIGGIRAMVDAIMGQDVLRNLFEADGFTEHSLFMVDDATGLPTRGRLDKFARLNGRMIIGDLKCTSIDPADKRQVEAKIHSFKYHQQAAHYWDLCEAAYVTPVDFVFAFVRNSPPYNAVGWTLTPNAIELGRRRNRVALDDLRRRLDTGDWVGERHGYLSMADLPKYAYMDDPDANPLPTDDFANFVTYR